MAGEVPCTSKILLSRQEAEVLSVRTPRFPLSVPCISVRQEQLVLEGNPNEWLTVPRRALTRR